MSENFTFNRKLERWAEAVPDVTVRQLSRMLNSIERHSTCRHCRKPITRADPGTRWVHHDSIMKCWDKGTKAEPESEPEPVDWAVLRDLAEAQEEQVSA